QRNEADAVRIGLLERADRGLCEPRLADAARPDQRQQPCACSQIVLDGAYLVLAAKRSRQRLRRARTRRRGVGMRGGRLETFRKQPDEVTLDQAHQLLGRPEALVGGLAVGLKLPQQLRQPRFALRRRMLDVEQAGAVPGQPVLVLQSGNGFALADPAVALPVNAY